MNRFEFLFDPLFILQVYCIVKLRYRVEILTKRRTSAFIQSISNVHIRHIRLISKIGPLSVDHNSDLSTYYKQRF